MFEKEREQQRTTIHHLGLCFLTQQRIRKKVFACNILIYLLFYGKNTHNEGSVLLTSFSKCVLQSLEKGSHIEQNFLSTSFRLERKCHDIVDVHMRSSKKKHLLKNHN